MTSDGQPALVLALWVNGSRHRIEAPPHRTLLEVLRDQLGLYSVREGCGIGVCGACTVLVDGRPLSSCLTLAAMAEGRDILTVEGLSPGVPGFATVLPASTDASGAPPLPVREGGGEGARPLHPIQEAFVARSGFQCSYCTPGFILTAKALLDERPDASDEEIREYLAGNLCRCGSYVKIMDSVKEAIIRLRMR